MRLRSAPRESLALVGRAPTALSRDLYLERALCSPSLSKRRRCALPQTPHHAAGACCEAAAVVVGVSKAVLEALHSLPRGF